MTIVVGYTATPSARAALDQAIAIAWQDGQRLVVVTGARERGQRDSRRLGEEQRAELDGLLESTGLEVVRVSLIDAQLSLPQYAADNHAAWAAYFERRQRQRLASTNDAPVVGGQKNSEGRHL